MSELPLSSCRTYCSVLSCFRLGAPVSQREASSLGCGPSTAETHVLTVAEPCGAWFHLGVFIYIRPRSTGIGLVV